MNVCGLTLAISHPHRSRTGTTRWGVRRMLQWVCEWCRPSSPSKIWVAGSLSSYDVFIYLFCIELRLYSKDVTFVSIPWVIICVRLGPSTHGDYVYARVPKTRVWQRKRGQLRARPNIVKQSEWHLRNVAMVCLIWSLRMHRSWYVLLEDVVIIGPRVLGACLCVCEHRGSHT
jgi:hypothetical protein